jgi:hypothetical protein
MGSPDGIHSAIVRTNGGDVMNVDIINVGKNEANEFARGEGGKIVPVFKQSVIKIDGCDVGLIERGDLHVCLIHTRKKNSKFQTVKAIKKAEQSDLVKATIILCDDAAPVSELFGKIFQKLNWSMYVRKGG